MFAFCELGAQYCEIIRHFGYLTLPYNKRFSFLQYEDF